MKKKIRCWKAICTECSLQSAIELCNKNKWTEETNDRIGIGLNKYAVIEDFEIPDHTFSSKDILNNNWAIYVPDTNAEQITEKCRQILKESHFIDARHQKIDTMNIQEMFYEITEKLLHYSDNVKYKLIKKLLEEKLYKE